MGKLAMFIKSTAKPGKRDELQSLYRELLAPKAMQNGAQEGVVWCADQHDWLPKKGTSDSELPIGAIEKTVGPMTIRTRGTLSRMFFKFGA